MSFKLFVWSHHKITQAVLGCVCPLLATSSALGLLFWFGFRFGTILCVTPFLVLAIGVDDAYLMMHSWMRISNEDSSLTKRERVAHMLVDVGPSVSITSLTNFLAFLVGIYTPTPEIQLFCIGNAVAILFDFIYQIIHMLDDYSQWLANKFTSVFLFFALCCYWYLSIVGASQIDIVLSPDKLVLEDSPLIEVCYHETIFLKTIFPLTINL
uniref:SSD domain-containing protein n=1 Tax=Heterorhabditis bacteriophora TaxID=37862 RepID=A0A1I7WSX3_HETBA